MTLHYTLLIYVFLKHPTYVEFVCMSVVTIFHASNMDISARYGSFWLSGPLIANDTHVHISEEEKGVYTEIVPWN